MPFFTPCSTPRPDLNPHSNLDPIVAGSWSVTVEFWAEQLGWRAGVDVERIGSKFGADVVAGLWAGFWRRLGAELDAGPV